MPLRSPLARVVRAHDLAVEDVDDPAHDRRRLLGRLQIRIVAVGRLRESGVGENFGANPIRSHGRSARGVADRALEDGAGAELPFELLIQDLAVLLHLEHRLVERVLSRERDPHGPGRESEERALLEARAEEQLALLHALDRGLESREVVVGGPGGGRIDGGRRHGGRRRGTGGRGGMGHGAGRRRRERAPDLGARRGGGLRTGTRRSRRSGRARGGARRRGASEPRLERLETADQVVDRRRCRHGAELDQADLEERPGRLRATERAATLEEERQHRAQVVRVERAGLRGVALAIRGRRVDQPVERRIDREQHELAEMVREAVGRFLHVHAAVVEPVERLERPLRAASRDRLAEIEVRLEARQAERLRHRLRRDAIGSDRERLVEARERVPHRALRRARDERRRLCVEAHVLERRHRVQVRDQLRALETAELEDLAARGDRVGHLERLGGREDEPHVRRRLLERLQQRVPGEVGELMRFVDDVDLGLAARRRVLHVLAQIPDLLDAAVRGAVDLEDVHRRAGGDLEAGARTRCTAPPARRRGSRS